MSNFYYELPSTDASQFKEMQYGLGVQPTIGFFANNPKMFHGLKFSLERDFYKRNQYSYQGDIYPTRMQTLRFSSTAYLGYNFTDKFNLKTELTYDWDKQGDQVETLSEWNPNMDDVIELWSTYNFSRKLSLGLGLQKTLSNISSENSAALGRINISL